MEKKKSSGERRPEIAEFCPLSWSNVSWHSRLSFLLQSPRTPEAFQKGYVKGVSEGVSEVFLKGCLGVLEGVSRDPSKPLQNAFKNLSKTLQEGVEIDDALP